MNQTQIEAIPSAALFERDTHSLREWLHLHGLRMTLLELDDERHRRNQTTRRSPRQADRKNYR